MVAAATIAALAALIGALAAAIVAIGAAAALVAFAARYAYPILRAERSRASEDEPAPREPMVRADDGVLYAASHARRVNAKIWAAPAASFDKVPLP